MNVSYNWSDVAANIDLGCLQVFKTGPVPGSE